MKKKILKKKSVRTENEKQRPSLFKFHIRNTIDENERKNKLENWEGDDEIRGGKYNFESSGVCEEFSQMFEFSFQLFEQA